jgi:glucarate dehydratase
MRIAAIDTVTVNIPFRRAHRSAGRTGRGVTRTLVTVTGDDGTAGIGETLHHQSKHVIDHVLAPAVMGADPRDLAWLRARCLPGLGQPGAPSRAWESDPWAYSGFEMAVYDLLAKADGIPLCRWLGGQSRSEIPFVEYVYPDATHATPEAIADDCIARVTTSGAHTLELKVGVLEPAADIVTIARIRRGVDPGVQIRIDANGAWSVPTAIRTLRTLEEQDLANVEEPCRGLTAMARVRTQVRIPLSTHVADVATVASLEAADSIVFDLPSEGGLESARQAAAAADSWGLGFWMRSTGELGVGTAAILHLAAATPAMRHAHQTILHLLEDDVTQERLRIHRGYVEVPGAPGLGVALDEAKVRTYARLHAEQGTYWFWGERHQPRWQPPSVW